MKNVSALALGSAAVCLMASPLVAQAAPGSKPLPGSPDEVVCQKEEVIGSRLATRRVCLTRAQWAERQQAERDMIAQQKNGPCLGGRSASGATSAGC